MDIATSRRSRRLLFRSMFTIKDVKRYNHDNTAIRSKDTIYQSKKRINGMINMSVEPLTNNLVFFERCTLDKPFYIQV